MPKTPNPCIDVCKYKREGHCIGCSMTKAQKSLFKSAKAESQRAGFVTLLMAQHAQLGGFDGWQIAYAKKCQKKGVTPPFPITTGT